MLERIFGTETEFGLYNEQSKDYDPEFVEKISPQASSIDIFLYNGGRLYREEACRQSFTPEYSTPECRSVKDLVCWEKAGEIILRLLLEKNHDFARAAKHGRDILMGKKDENVSGHHENYSILTDSSVVEKLFFDANKESAQYLGAFLVSRVLLHGCGFFDHEFYPLPYKISVRAESIVNFMGEGTISNRGIIDKSRKHFAISGPNMSPNNRRLHLILGDHNMSELSIYLTIGTTSLVLWMIEKEFLKDGPILMDPVHALLTFSGDPYLRSSCQLIDSIITTNSNFATALDLQKYFLLKAKEFVSIYNVPDEYLDIINIWDDVLARLKDDFRNLNGELDWVTKFCLIDSYLRARGSSWFNLHNRNLSDRPEARESRGRLLRGCNSLDLSYHFVDNEGIYYRLIRANKARRILTDREISNAVYQPPENTRAKIRGDFLRFTNENNLKESLSIEWNKFNVDLSYLDGISTTEFSLDIDNPFQSSSYLWEEYKKLILSSRSASGG